jgi:hypothetical protein
MEKGGLRLVDPEVEDIAHQRRHPIGGEAPPAVPPADYRKIAVRLWRDLTML